MSQWVLLWSLLLSPASAQEQPMCKAQAEAGISVIHSFYQNSIKRLSFTTGRVQDIEMACMGEIFLEWFYVYTDIIRRTDDLNFSEIQGYRDSEQKAHLVENDRQIYEVLRPEVTAIILDEIDQRRKAAEWPIGPKNLTLEEVQQAQLLSNYDECRNPEFVSAVTGNYNIASNYLDEKVTRSYADYQPRHKPDEPPSYVPPIYSDIDHGGHDQMTTTYEEWLWNIRTR